MTQKATSKFDHAHPVTIKVTFHFPKFVSAYKKTQYLKVREHISLTKNYCITIGIKKISSIHKYILKKQQILGSHELMGHNHF